MPQSDPAIGKVIDGYKVLDVLGQGGMGIVYKAEDVALSRQVALKMINPELASQDMFLRRFQLEAKALARVDSPYIVGVHALRKSGEHVFIVMEFVDGWTLSDEMDKGILDSKRSFSILKQLLQAFSHAHGVGVVHRDIKPSNIMISRSGRVKVTDFGLAKLRREDGMTTVTQGIAGTARYMSPEQVLGKKIDHRSDIYSLGMTLYHMFAGQLPFGPEEGTYSILKRVVEEEFVEVTEINSRIPQAISEVISKAIAKEPDDRFQTAEEMLEVLEAAYGFSPSQEGEEQTHRGAGTRQHYEPAPPQPQKPPAKAKSNKLLIYGAIALVLISIYPIYSFVSNSGGDNGGTNPVTSVQPAPDPGIETASGETTSTETPPETAFAFLTISSTPRGATVWIDDSSLGKTTPVRSEKIEAGTVEVRVTMPGYIPQRRMVTLDPGSTPAIEFELQRETQIAERPVEVIEQPSVEVPDQITEGPGGGQETTPSTTEGTPETPPEEPAEAATATLQLFAEPAGLIFVGNDRFENESVQDWTVGRYDIRIVDPNNPDLACTETIMIAEGSVTNRTCYFSHRLTIVTENAGGGIGAYANLKINGQDFGTTPLAGHEILSGTYEIELSRFGYDIERSTRTVQLNPYFGQDVMTHKESFLIKSQ